MSIEIISGINDIKTFLNSANNTAHTIMLKTRHCPIELNNVCHYITQALNELDVALEKEVKGAEENESQ